jgi:hypothetical protein
VAIFEAYADLMSEIPETLVDKDPLRHAMSFNKDIQIIQIHCEKTHADEYLLTHNSGVEKINKLRPVFCSRKTTFGQNIIYCNVVIEDTNWSEMMAKKLKKASDQELLEEEFYMAQNTYMNLLVEELAISETQVTYLRGALSNIGGQDMHFDGHWHFKRQYKADGPIENWDFAYYNNASINNISGIVNGINDSLNSYCITTALSGKAKATKAKLYIQYTIGFLASFMQKKNDLFDSTHWITKLNQLSLDDLTTLVMNVFRAETYKEKVQYVFYLLQKLNIMKQNELTEEELKVVEDLVETMDGVFIPQITHHDEIYGIFTANPTKDSVIRCSLEKYIEGLNIISSTNQKAQAARNKSWDTIKGNNIKYNIEWTNTLDISPYIVYHNQKRKSFFYNLNRIDMDVTATEINENDFDIAILNPSLLLQYLDLYGNKLEEEKIKNIISDYNINIDVIIKLIRTAKHDVKSEHIQSILNILKTYDILLRLSFEMANTSCEVCAALFKAIIQLDNLESQQKTIITNNILFLNKDFAQSFHEKTVANSELCGEVMSRSTLDQNRRQSPHSSRDTQGDSRDPRAEGSQCARLITFLTKELYQFITSHPYTTAATVGLSAALLGAIIFKTCFNISIMGQSDTCPALMAKAF